jgi:hypothetical protein
VGDVTGAILAEAKREDVVERWAHGIDGAVVVESVAIKKRR